MTFKEYLQLEDGQSSEQGLMVNKPAKNRKPSDGYPFAQNLSPYSDNETSGGGNASDMSGAMFMKKMKKMMKKMMKK